MATDDRSEFAHLLAIALSTVVPIYLRTNPTGDGLGDALPLATQEINELLFKPVKDGRLRSTLDGLLIRRSDLRRGIATLKAARRIRTKLMAADKTESLLRRSQFRRRESALAIALTCLRLVRTRWLLG